MAKAAAAMFFSSLKKRGEIIKGYKKSSSSTITGRVVGNEA
jgi:hypothetical protein